MHSRLTIAGFLLAAPLYAQQSPGIVRTEYDMDKVVARSSFSDEQLRGRKTFVQRCAICHDPLGQPAGRTIGPWLDSARVKAKGEATLTQTISTGVRGMPGWQYTLEPTQIAYVLEYLKTITPDQRPAGLKYEVDENK
jgi:mono/diheme cytochrome c family protein